MRGQVVRLLQPIGAYAVENGGCHPGTPDIATVLGPIECKATNHWPARDDTPVRLDHPLTKGQCIFIMKWNRVNGSSWVILNIAGDWLLFRGMVAIAVLGGSDPGTKAELFASAEATWDRKPSTQELLAVLHRTRHPDRP